ncbi:demethylmenaquinone methyltransferase [Microlunatus sp. Y2014]|uniref:demethylmenaquinone methyltransferase n=1 Tax=Microlunatus sp. Y2014 TaxID=3418488 RepID=UPI003DA7074E
MSTTSSSTSPDPTRRSYRATLAKRRADVAEMFDGVAARYDLTNGVMTGGLDRSWRRETVEAIEPTPGQLILDLAAGTGASSLPLRDAGATVVSADLSLGMLKVGRERHPELNFTAGDALRLPFGDATFDTVTISFGLRNVEDTVAALTELRRVTKPRGRIVICEFSRPTSTLIRTTYDKVVMPLLPKIAGISASNKAAYTYLSESIMAWPDQLGLATLMIEAGWNVVEWRNLSSGIVALHRARA